MDIKYRGWKGHFCNSDACTFGLNTLITQGKTSIVVSTVGLLIVEGAFKPIDTQGRYFETKAFYADSTDYQDAIVELTVKLEAAHDIEGELFNELKACKVHEAAVEEIKNKLINGTLC